MECNNNRESFWDGLIVGRCVPQYTEAENKPDVVPVPQKSHVHVRAFQSRKARKVLYLGDKMKNMQVGKVLRTGELLKNGGLKKT